jgi:hypothetical protein
MGGLLLAPAGLRQIGVVFGLAGALKSEPLRGNRNHSYASRDVQQESVIPGTAKPTPCIYPVPI